MEGLTMKGVTVDEAIRQLTYIRDKYGGRSRVSSITKEEITEDERCALDEVQSDFRWNYHILSEVEPDPELWPRERIASEVGREEWSRRRR
jgi:hypothetical protein